MLKLRKSFGVRMLTKVLDLMAMEGFFRATWHIIGPEVFATIKEFFENGMLLKQLNTIKISLISKGKRPDYTSQFRPISYCYTLSKCISKILCSRLKKILDSLVNPTQTTFIQGRTLIQNVLICHDLMRYYNRKTTPRCFIKNDLR